VLEAQVVVEQVVQDLEIVVMLEQQTLVVVEVVAQDKVVEVLEQVEVQE
jgi:hypothetical protein